MAPTGQWLDCRITLSLAKISLSQPTLNLAQLSLSLLILSPVSFSFFSTFLFVFSFEVVYIFGSIFLVAQKAAKPKMGRNFDNWLIDLSYIAFDICNQALNK